MRSDKCPWCQNDDTSMMEVLGIFIDATRKNGSTTPVKKTALLCAVCGKIFHVKEPAP